MLNVAVRKKLLQAIPVGALNSGGGEGAFRPHYVTWSEQRRIESQAPHIFGNIVQIMTETDSGVQELTPMRKPSGLCECHRLIPDSKTPNGIAEIPSRLWRSKPSRARF